jgi:hypothetical protein
VIACRVRECARRKDEGGYEKEMFLHCCDYWVSQNDG